MSHKIKLLCCQNDKIYIIEKLIHFENVITQITDEGDCMMLFYI